MNEKHEISNAFYHCIKIYGIGLILAIFAFNVARWAERKAFEAGVEQGRHRYWEQWDAIVRDGHRRRSAERPAEKVEEEAHG